VVKLHINRLSFVSSNRLKRNLCLPYIWCISKPVKFIQVSVFANHKFCMLFCNPCYLKLRNWSRYTADENLWICPANALHLTPPTYWQFVSLQKHSSAKGFYKVKNVFPLKNIY